MRPEVDLFDGVHVVVTTRADGNQRPRMWRGDDVQTKFTLSQPEQSQPEPEQSELVQRAIVDVPWTFVRQVHGNAVVSIVDSHGAFETDADAIVTTSPDVPIAMLGADCALIGLASSEGVIGVAHVGWRGLVAGVLEQTALAMRALGASEITAVVGPTIGPECYEFSTGDLIPIAKQFGDQVHARTTVGRDALDLRAGIEIACTRVGVRTRLDQAVCTVCDPNYYSWRAHHDHERHALVIWRESSEPAKSR